MRITSPHMQLLGILEEAEELVGEGLKWRGLSGRST